MRGALPAGTRLYDFEILSVLGQDDCGITYLARDTSLDCRVAIKEYLPTSLAERTDGLNVLPRSTELAAQFVQERECFVDKARALAKLGEAPAIVRIDDLFEANGTAYLVMALAKGETLQRRLLRDKHLPPPIAERMFSELLDGLAKVHAAGLLHLDITPAHVVVDSRGNPTLIDFAGVRTATAAALTPGYAALEQCTSTKQGPWTDIYSLSATLYHAITGALPPSAMDRAFDDGYKPLATSMPPGFALGLLTGIDAGLRVHPADRPQSIAAWRSTLPLSRPPAEPPHFTLSRTFELPRPSVAALAAAATVRPGPWLGLSAAVAATLIVSVATVRLMASSTAPPEVTQPVVADLPQQTPFDDVLSRASVASIAKSNALETTMPAMAGDSAQKADSEPFVATAAVAVREEEPPQTPPSPESVAMEAARQMAEVDGRPAASEAAAVKPTPSGPETEAALNLSDQDRVHVQAILTSLGHEIPTTGYFGSITRSMIAAWQKAQGLPETGYLDAAQLATLYAAEQTRLAAPKAEATLNLSDQDRRQVQTALTALGHEVPATGYFGPITRSMIAAWQRAKGQSPTGFLTADQFASLQQAATVQVVKSR